MRPWSIVGLERGQWRRTYTLWLLLFFLTVAFELGSDTIKALFLNRIGSQALPPAFVLEFGLRLGATLFYFLILRTRSYRKVMAVTTVIYGATLAFLLGALHTEMSGSLTAFYAIERVGFKLIMLHWGVYIVDFFTVGESSTAFPVVYSAQPFGSVVAGLLLAFYPFADVSYLLVVAGASCALALVFIRVAGRAIEDSKRVQVEAPDDGGSPWGVAWRYVRRAPVVRAMALATAALVFVRALLQVSAAHVLEEQFASAQSIGHFLGTYKVLSNVLVFGLQALLSARLMKYFAPTRVNFAYALSSLLAFGMLFLLPGTASLVFAESVRKEFKSVLKTPFSVMMYGAMADYARALGRILVFGVVVPLSGVAAGLAMMTMQHFEVATDNLVIPGLVVGLLFVLVTLQQNRAYKLALVDMLRDKLNLPPEQQTSSSLMRIPDGRILDIRHVRQRFDYLVARDPLARRLFPDLYEPVPAGDALAASVLLERLEEVLLVMELYRPRGAPFVRRLLVSALRDRRTDLKDNAFEAVNSILPPRLANRARALLEMGLDRGVELPRS